MSVMVSAEESQPVNDMVDFTPREYQVELLQAALEENIIVYLPTGSGKTFIAASLIKEMSNEVTKTLDEGGKRTVFLVPTIVLAIQQAAYLKRHTHLQVKEFYGSMGVDMWGEHKWKTEFENNHVLVMTAQVFVDVLNHAFFSPHKLNLVVFDECHSAVKDAPMKQVLSKIRSCSEIAQRPKILGLTAALFRMRCRPEKVKEIIRQLSESMGCVVKTPSNIVNVYRSSTKPCEIIIQYDDDNNGQHPDVQKLTISISAKVFSLTQKFQEIYGDSSVVLKPVDKINVLWDALKDLEHLLRVFGIYGAFHCAIVYIRILQRAKIRAKDPQFLSNLNKVIALCQEVREICTPVFEKFPAKDLVQPRIIRLLDILRQFKPEQNPDGIQIATVKMCCIIFVERRSVANVLYHFLKDVRQHDSDFDFLKPLFTMGQASGRMSSHRESQILNMKQKEIMYEFREGNCNLLVATSVLEEGIDIPACNLIIRFDEIKTYCNYVQTKGRARSSKAFYCILTSKGDTETCFENIAQFHSIEQQLLATENFQDDQESLLDSFFNEILEPYAPFGDEGPRVTLLSSISLVNRYCSTLSASDNTVVLAPQWSLKKVDESVVDPSWLKKILELLKNLQESSSSAIDVAINCGLFQCSLILPLNSPLREVVIGEVMPTKRLAKRAVALKTCKILHRLKELNDSHLFPIIRLEPDEEEEDLIGELEENTLISDNQQGNEKKAVYSRRFPACFSNCRPKAGQISFVYSIDFTLLKPCLDTSKLYFPFAVNTKLAILTSKCIPATCAFPLITRAGEFEVNLFGDDSVMLDDQQIKKLEKFHQFLFQDVIFLWKRQLNFNSEDSLLQYLIVPLHCETKKIAFDLVEKMISTPIIDWDEPACREEKFNFDRNVFTDAVIVPFYKPLGKLNTFYVDCLSNLTPLSPFPNEQYENYASYFLEKHKLKLTNLEQPLLQVSREITGKNFLIPREVKPKDDFIYLVPELCHPHPLPASIWKQVVWIPSVLHRLNGMLVAEELRLLLCKETKIGMIHLPGAINVSTVWCPIRIQHHSNVTRPGAPSRIIPDPRLQLKSFQPSTLEEMLDGDSSLIWSMDYSEADNEIEIPSPVTDSIIDIISMTENQNSDNESADSTLSSLRDASVSFESNESIDNQKRKWIELALESSSEDSQAFNSELFNLSFDAPNPSTLSVFGPSPGLILEALTLTKARDGFDMERLETIGDSILKLIISVYVYGETSDQRCDEGRLTLMRTRQIKNTHLFLRGQRKAIGEFIVAHRFDMMANFLPPAFQTPESKNETNLHVQQFVPMKNVADCMESLIGVYLLTNGIKGAIRVMEWMGLKTVPRGDIQTFNGINGIPIITPSVESISNEMEDRERSLLHLYSGLESFEKRLRYTFKNKALLVEALTHPSYISNRITNCYQRLEFLGDAVLDYLVTRFYYDNPCQYSPAVLTDLRSAMVNNQTFAVMAVKNRFHLYLKHLSVSLSLIMDRFVRAQEDNGHLLMHDHFVLEEGIKPNEHLASNIDVPKVLGDVFESVAGAIFVDSGMSLDAVWKAYLPFLNDALEQFNEVTPISALRTLHERHPCTLKFRKPETLPDGRLCVAIEIDSDRVFKGAGGNSKTAKSAAAKYALSILDSKIPNGKQA